jgi:RNA recognition motif-containing protein
VKHEATSKDRKIKFEAAARKALQNGLSGTGKAKTKAPIVPVNMLGMPMLPPMMMPPGMGPPRPPSQPQIPDELLPPNHILFIQHLPTTGSTQQRLQSSFGSFMGFKEVRMIPGRHDIAFVEFESEQEAANAKSSLNGMQIDGNMIKVTFSRK